MQTEGLFVLNRSGIRAPGGGATAVLFRAWSSDHSVLKLFSSWHLQTQRPWSNHHEVFLSYSASNSSHVGPSCSNSSGMWTMWASFVCPSTTGGLPNWFSAGLLRLLLCLCRCRGRGLCRTPCSWAPLWLWTGVHQKQHGQEEQTRSLCMQEWLWGLRNRWSNIQEWLWAEECKPDSKGARQRTNRCPEQGSLCNRWVCKTQKILVTVLNIEHLQRG